jgi:hypothetical protein
MLTHDQPTLTMQRDARRVFTTWRHRPITDAVEASASGARDQRLKRQTLLKAAKQRQRDTMLARKVPIRTLGLACLTTH